MARKKNKKKNSKKKDLKKKELKKKAAIKKELKKKKIKKRETKKKYTKNKKIKKKKKALKIKPVKADKPKIPSDSSADHSSNYNVRDAIAKLRSLKSLEQVKVFTKGETRITITRSIPAVMNRFK